MLACASSDEPGATTSALSDESSSTLELEVTSSSTSTGSSASTSQATTDDTSTDALGTNSTTTGDDTTTTINNDATTTGGATPECGDGHHDLETEECDEGEDNSDEGSCTTECTLAVCGDNKRGPGEECDLGPLNDDNGDSYPTCSESCELLIGCGDGVLQPSEEECDHDGRSDTCSPKCEWWGRVVFVSSTAHTGDLGGLAGADEVCRELAFGAGLAHPTSYRAWLSTDSESIASWITATDEGKKLVRADGWTIANNLEEFFAGPFKVPINVTEWGEPAEFSAMWTNTSNAGHAVSEDDCDGWTRIDAAGHAGENGKLDVGWTDSYGNQSCANLKHLYCVEGLPNANP